MELEAQIFMEDVSAGFSNILDMVNPAECIAQSPRVVFTLKKQFDLDVTQWTHEGRANARKSGKSKRIMDQDK